MSVSEHMSMVPYSKMRRRPASRRMLRDMIALPPKLAHETQAMAAHCAAVE